MFGRKTCSKCGKKVSSSADFCPKCGLKIQSSEDWGMLGKNDLPDQEEIRLPFGFNTIFKALTKSLDKQLKELSKEMEEEMRKSQSLENQNAPKKGRGISISITTSGNKPPEIRVNSFGEPIKQEKQGTVLEKRLASRKISPESLKKISQLSKKEPSTNVRRFSDKIVYEIKMPGVKNMEDISIIKLENSIEIKALSSTGKSAYSKVLQVALPLVGYKLSKGILTLELDANEN